MTEGWFSNFFQGLTLDVWDLAMTEETTAEEAVFIANNLLVEEGNHLLDIPCGNGRLCFMLANMGFEVTGVDTSNTWLEAAQSLACAHSISTVHFIAGDMRSLDFNHQFDGAYCMGNSFGFFGEEESKKFLSSLCRVLKPGCRIIIDTLMVAETFLTNGAEREWQKHGDIYMMVENKYDCRNSVVESVYSYFDKSNDNRMQTSTAYYHIFTSGQICNMLSACGFQTIELYSSTEEELYELGSPRLLLIAEKRL